MEDGDHLFLSLPFTILYSKNVPIYYRNDIFPVDDWAAEYSSLRSSALSASTSEAPDHGASLEKATFKARHLFSL